MIECASRCRAERTGRRECRRSSKQATKLARLAGPNSAKPFLTRRSNINSRLFRSQFMPHDLDLDFALLEDFR